MTLTLGMVTIDTHDADALADWWAEQMGAEVMERNDGWYVVLQGGTLPIRLSFQKVEDPTPGKNRIHLDVMAADLDAEVDRLLGGGRDAGRATRRRELPLGHPRRPARQRVLRREHGCGDRGVLTDPTGGHRSAGGGAQALDRFGVHGLVMDTTNPLSPEPSSPTGRS